jgi:hypothetical protein
VRHRASVVSRRNEQLCIFADAVDNCRVVPERSTGLLAACLVIAVAMAVMAVIAGFLAVMPDLIRHPWWRAQVDCGSSPQ